MGPIHLLEWIDHAHSIAADEGVRADAVEMAYFATAGSCGESQSVEPNAVARPTPARR